MFGTWYLVHGMVFSIWYLIFGVVFTNFFRYNLKKLKIPGTGMSHSDLLCGILLFSIKYLVIVFCYLVCGIWHLVFSIWCVVGRRQYGRSGFPVSIVAPFVPQETFHRHTCPPRI